LTFGIRQRSAPASVDAALLIEVLNTREGLKILRTSSSHAELCDRYVQLRDDRFHKLYHSPLRRAVETADIVWNGNGGTREIIPALREIDLYSFQGLLKAEGRERFGDEFTQWQQVPAEFEIDGQKPVIELWHRASMVWQHVLLDEESRSCALVVAHNAVNQALVATAIGIGPDFFRRLLQSNAASTVLDFVPRVGGGAPVVTIDRLNQVCSTLRLALEEACYFDKPHAAVHSTIYYIAIDS
jgi:broad specificity phosphatase PhoE